MSMPERGLLDVPIAGLRLSALLRLYEVRMRRQAPQELLAGAGIAVGVALVFGVLVANMSVLGSAQQLIDGVTGTAQLQLAARSPEGFPDAIARRAARLPGVAKAAPMLRQDAVIEGRDGARSVQLVGVTSQLIGLHSAATRSFSSGALLSLGGLALPLSVAEAIGADAGEKVRLRIAGMVRRVVVSTELGAQTIGPAAESPVVVTLLRNAQLMSGERGRVTQVLIEPRPGMRKLVLAALRKLAAGRLDVVPAKRELQVLASAARPLDQSTALFAAIGAMVGFLLALGAALIRTPERSQDVAEMALQGFDRRQMLLILGSQAIVLGTLASLVGIGIGYLLARTLFYQPSVYLSSAFPVYFHQSVQPWVVLIALAGGVLAALVCALPPIYALRSTTKPTADSVLQESGEPCERIPARLAYGLGLVALALIGAASALAAAVPSLSVLAGVMLAIAVPFGMPALFHAALGALSRLGRSLRGSMLALAVVEMRCTATRSVTLVGVTALALYGSVSIGATRHDLMSGFHAAVTEYLRTADVWVAENDNFLTIDGFARGGPRAAIAKLPQVSSVRVYGGALLDVGDRRLWVRARPPGDSPIVQPSQLIEGSLKRASALIRGDGWAAISSGFASEHGLRVGDSFSLPTPEGDARLRVAAITTNAGWAPGAITISIADYRRWWDTTAATALEVDLRHGVTSAAGRRAVQRALGPHSGLVVETRAQRARIFEATAREGVRSLGEISNLLLMTAALSLASALAAAIWQRRGWLATMKTQGFDSWQLLRCLLLESLVAVSVGCAGGAAIGIYGHVMANRWLTITTGFPAPFALGEQQLLAALAAVVAVTMAMVALPGWSAARAAPAMGLRD